MNAKDLTVEEPAPFGSVLDGYAYIPRMLDKARATLAGTNGNYLFGCPVDHTCMARLGIAPELVLELAAAHDDDLDVLAALREHGIPSAEKAWFDAPAVEDELQGPGFYLRVRPNADARCSDEWHAHEHDELVLVLEGDATWYLGSQQARTVRAGESVRVPAGIEHRCVPGQGFRATRFAA
jgi:mannose-6-phosphate isomerase-like protein (cupin superfamily)